MLLAAVAGRGIPQAPPRALFIFIPERAAVAGGVDNPSLTLASDVSVPYLECTIKNNRSSWDPYFMAGCMCTGRGTGRATGG